MTVSPYLIPGIVREVAVKSFIDVACEHFHVEKEKMLSKCKDGDVVLARQALFYHMKINLNGYSYCQIARIFDKNHATVVHGVKMIRRHMKLEPHTRDRINGLFIKLEQ